MWIFQAWELPHHPKLAILRDRQVFKYGWFRHTDDEQILSIRSSFPILTFSDDNYIPYLTLCLNTTDFFCSAQQKYFQFIFGCIQDVATILSESFSECFLNGPWEWSQNCVKKTLRFNNIYYLNLLGIMPYLQWLERGRGE